MTAAGAIRRAGATLGVALRLGRVSNLPTVWTNVAAAVVLAGAPLDTGRMLSLLVALSMLYVAGMYLNDAFDRDFDRRMRPERPIPRGEVTAGTVFGVGFALLSAGVGTLTLAAFIGGGTGWPPVAAGVALAAAIVLYSAWHKGNPLGPLLMGLCRMLCYLVAGLAVTLPLPPAVLLAAAATLCYVAGVSYAARQETTGRLGRPWPLLLLAVPVLHGLIAVGPAPGSDLLSLASAAALAAWIGFCVRTLRQGGPAIGVAVGRLLAGICLVDALSLAGRGAVDAAALAVAGFLLTLTWQRRIAGT